MKHFAEKTVVWVALFMFIFSLTAFAEKQDVDIDVGVYSDVKGDINNDEVMDFKDVVVSAKLAAGWKFSAGQINHKFTDVNSDGKINLSDTVLLARKIAGWNVTVYPTE